MTNTPSLRNLSQFSVFLDVYLILFVRNGRAVVASMAKSFSIPLTKGMRDWTEAANHILAYDRVNRDSGLRYAIVRYEELAANVYEVMHRRLRFADLDSDQYDFDAAAEAPIIGSSVVFGPVTQGSQLMTAEFEPHKRTLAWSRRIQARFAWLAGQQFHKLGYRYGKERTGRSLVPRTYLKIA